MNPSSVFVISELMKKAEAEEGVVRDIIDTFEIIGLLCNSEPDQYVVPPE